MPNRLRIMLAFWLSLLTLTPGLAKGETILEKIDRTGLLEVAIREDAVPFGYRDGANNLEGLCLDFIELTREELKKKLGLKVISIKIYKSTLFNRFDLVENKTVDFECGPNTIRATIDQNVTFSQPFFVTGTQFIIRTEQRANFNLSTLEEQRIWVLRGTTNSDFLRERYPKAIFEEFQGITGRARGVQALVRGRIDAFASDGILLLGEAIELGLALGADFVITPRNPLDCQYYGFILPNNDPQWKSFIDAVITTSQNRDILKQWFAEIAPYFRETLNYCGNQN
jgi:polar amino acid transport system substrate-binding protein